VKPRITVIGLGPGKIDLVTREAWEQLSAADQIFLRTKEHPSVSEFPPELAIHSFDSLYESAEDFEQVYAGIVERLLEEASSKGKVLYAVPGDPRVGEATVPALQIRAKDEGIGVVIMPAISFIEPCIHLLDIDALEGLQIADALELASVHHPPLSPDRPALVGQFYSRMIAADVKLTLLNQYPQSHPVKVVHFAGTTEVKVESMLLVEIDRTDDFSSGSTLYIPPLERASSFERLQDTVAHLRAPNGCPWDREQTHTSLRMHLLEECYETLQAIDRGDQSALLEELGDLFLQIVLHAQIATEAGDFRMAEVIAAINEKIVRRHPHVFDDLELEGVSEVLHNWEALKAAERDEIGNNEGIMEGVPIGLPALSQANELQGRAARVGFDWRELSGVVDKVDEELAEVFAAESDQEIESEIGDLFFALVNYARWKGVDPESALRQANLRFRQRFGLIENKARLTGQNLSEMTLEELDALWEEAKGQIG
jgi:tetrapyrrole methylase family protein/MazG family protein